MRTAQRPDQRDGTGDGGLVVEVRVVVPGDGVQRCAVLGEKGLVGGDDGGAVLERGGDEGAGGLDTADDLDDDVDVPRLTRAVASVVTSAGSMPSRTREGRRTATPASSTGAPMRAARSSACVVMMRATSEPTTPQPSSATFSGRVRIIRPRFLTYRHTEYGGTSLTHRTGVSIPRPDRETSISFSPGRKTEIFRPGFLRDFFCAAITRRGESPTEHRSDQRTTGQIIRRRAGEDPPPSPGGR